MEPILSNVPGSLPWHVWHERHPALFAKLKGAHPYPPEIRSALDELLDETLTGAIRAVPGWYDEYVGQRWLDVPFLWAESFFYRRMLEAVGYFSAGPWAGFDLFAAFKDADLADAPLSDLPALEPPELLLASLWGNQADLGFQIGVAAASGGPVGPTPGTASPGLRSAGSAATGATREGVATEAPEPALAEATALSTAHLVADESQAAMSILEGAPRVGLIADNAGKELLADLGLIDWLLSGGGHVTLHLKPHPYYVSDATTTDLAKCLQALAAAGGLAADIARRLHAAAADGRFLVATHAFFCAPLPFHVAPPDLFGPVDVLIFKGDLNYRRLVGDFWRPPSTPFTSTLPALPASVVALRTLKSDVLVGVDDSTVESLSGEKDWRVNGRYGSVQVFTP